MTLEGWFDVAVVSEVPIGTARVVFAGGLAVALCHTTEGFFALHNVCPHRGGPLGEGDVVGGEIVCPWHVWSFDIRSGICTGDPTVQVPTYDVRVEAGRVLVHIAREELSQS